MKTLCCLLICLLWPISPKAETVTLLEVDTTCYVGPFLDTCWVDTISRTFILPEWLAALRPQPITRFTGLRTDKVDTVIVRDTVYVKGFTRHIDTTLGRLDSIRTCNWCDYTPPRNMVRAGSSRSSAWFMDSVVQSQSYYDYWREIVSIDTTYIPDPRICPDTVRIVDTVCPCDHYYEWEVVCRDHFDRDSVTCWTFELFGIGFEWLPGDKIPHEVFRGYDCDGYITGNSKCIYCGKVRNRKEE